VNTEKFAKWAKDISEAVAVLIHNRSRLKRVTEMLTLLRSETEKYRAHVDKVEDCFPAKQASEVISLIDNVGTRIRAQETIKEYRRA
jgi:hypothetical protein